jgi:predicted esterase
MEYPELFDGVVCFGGWFQEEWLPPEMIERANMLRIFISHGTKDESMSIDRAYASRDLLEQYGFDVTFVEFDGGHSLPVDTLLQVEQWIENP